MHVQAVARLATIAPILPQPIRAERLGGVISVPMKAVLLPLGRPGWEASACGIWQGEREHHGKGVLGIGDGIAEGRVSSRSRRARSLPADRHCRRRSRRAPRPSAGWRFRRIFGVTLVAERMARTVVIADDGGELVLVLAQIGLEIHLDCRAAGRSRQRRERGRRK